VFSASLPLTPYDQTDLYLGSVLNLQSRQMTIVEAPQFVTNSKPKHCLIYKVDSYSDLMNVLTQTDAFKLINLKLGLLDNSVLQGLNVHEGQRVLAVEFLGTPSNSLLNDSRLLQNFNCYDPNYNSNLLFNKAIVQQSLSKKVSLCVVKPHIIKNHLLSKVLTDILNSGFDVTSVEIQNLNKVEVDEIFEVYKGVLND